MLLALFAEVENNIMTQEPRNFLYSSSPAKGKALAVSNAVACCCDYLAQSNHVKPESEESESEEAAYAGGPDGSVEWC